MCFLGERQTTIFFRKWHFASVQDDLSHLPSLLFHISQSARKAGAIGMNKTG